MQTFQCNWERFHHEPGECLVWQITTQMISFGYLTDSAAVLSILDPFFVGSGKCTSVSILNVAFVDFLRLSPKFVETKYYFMSDLGSDLGSTSHM